MIKPLNKDQVNKAIKSGEITASVLKSVKNYLNSGIATSELEDLALRIIASSGGKPAFLGYNGYKYASCISVNDKVVHGLPSPRTLKNGDIVSFDVGTNYQGINTDAAATFVVGDFTNNNEKRLVEGVARALEESIKIVRPGIKLGDIEATIGKTLKKYSLSPVMTLSGHGIGEKVHQEPSIMCDGQKGTGPLIETGFMFAIEPMATLGNGRVKRSDDGWSICSVDGSTGAHFEHTILVVKDGYKILTQYE